MNLLVVICLSYIAISVESHHFYCKSCSSTAVTGFNNNEYQISRGQVFTCSLVLFVKVSVARGDVIRQRLPVVILMIYNKLEHN